MRDSFLKPFRTPSSNLEMYMPMVDMQVWCTGETTRQQDAEAKRL